MPLSRSEHLSLGRACQGAGQGHHTPSGRAASITTNRKEEAHRLKDARLFDSRPHWSPSTEGRIMTARLSRQQAERLGIVRADSRRTEDGGRRAEEKKKKRGGARKTALPGLVVEALTRLGLWAFRVHSGKVQLRSGHWMALAPAGTPDVIILLPDGRMGACECKERSGRASRAQRQRLDAINRAGGVAFVAHSVAEAVEALQAEGVL